MARLRAKNGKWEATISLGTDPVTKRRRQRSKTFDGPKDQARLKANEWELRERSAPTRTGSFGALAQDYLSHLRALVASGERSKDTLSTYEAELNAHLLPALKDKRADRIEPGDLDEIYDALRSGGMQASSIAKVHATASVVFAHGERRGWVSTLPTRKANPPRQRRRKTRLPPIEAVLSMIRNKAIRDPNMCRAWLVLALVALRRGELVEMRVGDIDRDNRQLHVRGTKTEHSETVVPLSAAALSFLESQLDDMRRRARLAGVTLADDAYLWSDELDCSAPWNPDRITRNWARARKLHGLGEFRMHQLRKLFSTHLQSQGIPVATVARLLRHSSESTTLDHYSGSLSEDERRGAEVMAALVSGS